MLPFFIYKYKYGSALSGQFNSLFSIFILTIGAILCPENMTVLTPAGTSVLGLIKRPKYSTLTMAYHSRFFLRKKK